MTKPKILIVEDEFIVAIDIKDALERLGYCIPAIAHSAAEAIRQAAETQPDLVLMDIKLKGSIDGIEAAKQVRDRFSLPVIYLTAYADSHTLERAKATGPFGFILKPFKEKEVQATIEMALYQHRMETEIRQHNHRLLTLQSASAAVASSLDLHQVLETITRQMAFLLEAEACATFEWKPEVADVSLLAHYGTNGRWKAETRATRNLPVDYTSTQRALIERHPQQVRIGQQEIDLAELGYMQVAKVKTLVVLPMLFKDRVVGFVEITDKVERTFTDQELTLAQLLANHAASAIENARLYEEVRRRVEELTTLNEIGQAVNSTLDLEETLTLITDHTIRLLHADAASVALCDSESAALRFVAASGKASDFVLGKNLPTGQGLVGWVVERGEPALVPDVSQDARFFDGFDRESGFGTQSILCVPLQVTGRTIGVIEVMNKQNGSFGQDDLRLLNSMAAPAATAIENARLYRRAQQEIDDRARAEAALQAERASLAHRVAERTMELSKANADLEQASRLKDRFVSNVSHELRTPLSVITLLTGNLDMLYDRWDEEKRRQTIGDIRAHARLLNDLIESVLEISRIDSAESSNGHEELNLALLAREEVEKQTPLAQKRSQTMHVTGADQLTVSGNSGQLRQVIRNLLNNAIKYTPDGGKITCNCQVQAGLDVSGPSPSNRWAVLHMADTGIGIDKENIPKLFERFYRVNEQGNIPGVGLGLSIAKELVEQHSGHIAVASTLGKGTVFSVYLPLSEE